MRTTAEEASGPPLLSSRRTLPNLLRPYRARLVLLAVLSFAGGTAEALFLVLLTRAALTLTDDSSAVSLAAGVELTMGAAVVVGVTLVVAKFVLAAGAAVVRASLTSKVTADLRTEVGAAYLASDWPTQHDDPMGQLQTLLTNFTGSGSVVVGAITTLLTSGFNLLAMLLLAVLVDPIAALFVAVAIALLAAAVRPFQLAVGRQSRRASDANLVYSSRLSELSELGMELHVFNVQGAAGHRLQQLVDRQRSIDRRMRIYSELVPTVYTTLAYLAMVAAIAVIATGAGANLEAAGAVFLLMLRSMSYGQALQRGFTQVSAQRGWLAELTLRFERYVSSRRVDQGRPVGHVGVLELTDVEFEYVEGQPVFEHVNLRLEPGEVVGVVGPSGGGKSTLVQLLLGLRAPSNGTITSDGRDLTELSHEEWSRRVTFVPQHARLIAGTVAENIAFFRSDVTTERILEAAARANLLESIQSWPDGVDRQVGDGGSRLSGGQQQRVCIARALVENPDVIILDEPTSALDAASEMAVRDTLDQLRGRVTVVIIAHRPATIEICDRVVTVRDGQVTAAPR